MTRVCMTIGAACGGRARMILLLATATVGCTSGDGAPAATSGMAGAPAPGTEGALALLEGEWVGEGTLLGRPARFTMTWTRLDPGAFRLEFGNGMVGAGGDVTPVLSAVATYTLAADGSARGHWTDDRPQEIDIVADVADSVVVADWTAPNESGRTEYRVMVDGTVRVRDWVRSDGELRAFGEAVYRRR